MYRYSIFNLFFNQEVVTKILCYIILIFYKNTGVIFVAIVIKYK